MADLKISQLAALAAANVASGDLLAVVDTSASETKKITLTDLLSNASFTLVADASIPNAKIVWTSGTLDGAVIENNGIDAAQLNTDSVTAVKLADESTVDLCTTLPGAGAYVGQLAVDTDSGYTCHVWDGSAWQTVSAGTTTISGSTTGIVNIVATASGTTYTISATLDDTDAAKKFLAGPTGAGGAVSYRTIVDTDLPTATSSALGAVKINGEGLRLDNGVVEIDSDVTAATSHAIVTHTTKGIINGSRAIVSSDLPDATASAKGIVVPGTGLAVSSGTLNHSNSVSAGTGTKLTVDAQGHVTTIANLVAGDIPDISAAKITSGALDIARIADDSITAAKMANSSTCIVQSIAQSGYPTAAFTGQLLFDSVAEDAFLWDGNAWQAITTLTKGSLVNGGTFNCSTSKMASVTTAGSAAGLVVGSNLPTASATTDGVYVVVSTAGTPSAPAPVVALNPPDYVLGITNATGSSWNEIDLSATVSGQIAANVGFTPYGQLSSTNCQDVIQEIETEKLGKAGGEVTGELLIGAAGSLVFEGSTANAYETTIAVVDPSSADRTATFPDASGTVVLAGNAQIVNADISTSAAIALSKLANVTSGQLIVGNGSNVPTAVAMSGDATLASSGAITVAAGSTSAAGKLQLEDSAASTSTTKAATPAAVKVAKDAADAAATTANAALPKAGGDMTGNIVLDNDKEIRFNEADSAGSAYVGIKGAADKGAEASYTISLPAAAPTAGQVLKANSSTPTTLEWSVDSTNVAAGSLTGTTMASNVVTSSLTTVATIASGTWAATDVAVAHGGTGSSTAAGALTNLGALPTAGGTMSGAIAMGTSKITGLGDPTNAQDAATKAYITATSLPLAGGTLTGDVTINAQKDLRFADSDSSNWVALQAPATISSNVTWTLPAADGSAGYLLKTDGSGALGWVADSTTDSSKMPLAGGTFTGIVNYSNGKAARFYENTGNGSNYVGLRAPAALSGDTTYMLPTGDGSADEFLKTDGSGNLSWGLSSSGATGGATDAIFVENERTVTTSYSITATKNAHSVGPIALNSGVVVTVPSASIWMVS